MATFDIDSNGVLKKVTLDDGETSITLDTNVKEIGAFVFTEDVGVTSITLNTGCKVIRNKAFFFNRTLTELIIPVNSELEKIETYAFAGYNPLTSISGRSSSYRASTTGPLYNLEMTKVVLGVNKPKITFDSSTTEIGESAFSFCDKITSVDFPDTLTKIWDYAFSDCVNLNVVMIPSSVNTVGYGAFFGCDSVETVTLGGKINQSVTGVETLLGLSFSGMKNLAIVKMTNSVKEICSILGEETFADGGRRLMIDGNKESMSDYVKAHWQGTYGELPATVTLNFYTDPDASPSYVISGVVPGSTIESYLIQAKNALETLFDIKGWYTDDTLHDAVDNDTVVKNYKREANGEVSPEDEISIYAAYDVIVQYSDVYNTREKDGKITLVSVKDWDLLKKTGYDIPSTMQQSGSSEELEVTVLGDGLFEGAEIAATMTIPKTIRTIGKSVFRGCESLQEVIFEDKSKCGTIGVLAFSDTSIESIDIPDSVKRIRQGAFYGCHALSSITLGENVISIGSESGNNHGTFEDCDELTEVRIGSINQWLGIDFGNSACNPASNGGNLYIGKSDEPISSITSTEIGSKLTEIKDFTFVGCSSITNVDFSGTFIQKVGEEAFSACANLESVILDTGAITTLGRAAFSNCTSLKSIFIPHEITEIGSFVFNSCTGLETVSLQDGCTKVAESMFSNCTSLSTVLIPVTIEKICESAFSGCSGLTSVIYQRPADSMCNEIGAYAFYACGLVTIGGSGNEAMPLWIEKIGERAFARNAALTSAILPDGMKTLPSNVFEDCPNLPIVRKEDGYGYIDNWIFEDRLPE